MFELHCAQNYVFIAFCSSHLFIVKFVHFILVVQYGAPLVDVACAGGYRHEFMLAEEACGMWHAFSFVFAEDAAAGAVVDGLPRAQ